MPLLAAPKPVAVEPLDGEPLRSLGERAAPGRAVVLLFISDACPIANRYAPELTRIADEYSERGDEVWLVYPLPDSNIETLRRHAAEYSLAGYALWDPQLELTAWCGATRTPQAIVLAREAGGFQLVYRGRIDNWYSDFGQPRNEPTQRDLRDVLNDLPRAINAGLTETDAIGCVIPTLKP